MRTKYILLLFIIATVVSACNKFLDEKPKGLIIPEKLSDYEGLLNSSTLTSTFPPEILAFTDDYLGVFNEMDRTEYANAYNWRAVITEDEAVEPKIWGPLYNRIYSANVIINGVMDATSGTENDKKRVLSEALVMRADCYLNLLTVFAKAYNPGSAATDPGVPIPTSTDVTDKAPRRSSVKATFDKIIGDVLTAIEILPLQNVNRYRVTKYAAYSLLSRIYLYMADFPNAKKYTDLALQAPHRLLNYNDYGSLVEMPTYEGSIEALWLRTCTGNTEPYGMLYSMDLQSYFNDDDLRKVFLSRKDEKKIARLTFSWYSNFGTTFPEMYLTKAELMAREGKADEAMALVNLLRKNRIKTNVYTDQIASSPEEALIKVLAERRRELAFCGTRWLDMKRLDQEGRMPEVKRLNSETQAVEATLSPRSLRYTFEIPIRVRKFNPGIELNH